MHPALSFDLAVGEFPATGNGQVRCESSLFSVKTIEVELTQVSPNVSRSTLVHIFYQDHVLNLIIDLKICGVTYMMIEYFGLLSQIFPTHPATFFFKSH